MTEVGNPVSAMRLTRGAATAGISAVFAFLLAVAPLPSSAAAQSGESWFAAPETESAPSDGPKAGWFNEGTDTAGQTQTSGQTAAPPATEAPAAANVACLVQSKLIDDAATRIAAGNFGEGEALLRVVDIAGCADLAGPLAQARAAAALGRQKLAVDAGRAASSCDLVALRRSAEAVSKSMVPELQGQYATLSVRIASIERIAGRVDAARRSLGGGSSGSDIETLRAEIAALGPDPSCTRLAAHIDGLATDLAGFDAAVAAGKAAEASCSATTIGAAQNALRPWQARSEAARDMATALTERLTRIRRIEQVTEQATATLSSGAPGDIERLLAEARAMKAEIPADADPACASLVSGLDLAIAALDFSVKAGPRLTAAVAACEWNLSDDPIAAIPNADSLTGAERSAILDTVLNVGQVTGMFARALDGPAGETDNTIIDAIITVLDQPDVWYCRDMLDRSRALKPLVPKLQATFKDAEEAFKRCDASVLKSTMPLLTEVGRLYPPYAELPGMADKIYVYTEAMKKALADFDRAAAGDFDFEAEAGKLKALTDSAPRDLPPQYCPVETARIKDLSAKLQQARWSLDAVETALDTCDSKMLSDYLEVAELWPASRLSSRLDEVRTAAEMVDLLGSKGDDVELATQLNAMLAFIAKAEMPEAKGLCRGLMSQVRARYPGLLDAVTTLHSVDPATQACDIETMEALERKLRNSEHASRRDVVDALSRLRGRLETCGPELRRRAETACRASLGSHFRLLETAPNRFDCRCDFNYDKDAGGKCVASSFLLKSNADATCRSRHGDTAYAVDVTSETQFRCRCTAPQVMTQGRCSNPTGAALKAYADEICKKKFGNLSYPGDLKSVSDFKCYCAPPNKWSKDGKTCYRPSTKEMIADGWEACRKKYGSRLTNTIVGKDGSVTCYYKTK